MIYLITDDGCIWVEATSIVGIRRSAAEHVVVSFRDGKVVASRERYDRFVERLNDAWLRAAGSDLLREPGEAVTVRSIPSSSNPTADQGEIIPEFGLEPVLP